MSNFRFDFTLQNAVGEALPGVLAYVCTQPATTSSIPPSPLAQLFAGTSSNSASISAASWNGEVVSFTFSTTPPADVVVGSYLAISGILPIAYNGTYQILTVVGNVVTAILVSNPGAYVSGGAVLTSVLPNPVTTDGNGNGFFYAPAAEYTIVYFDPFGRIPTMIFPDQSVIGPGAGTVTSVAMTAPDGFVTPVGTVTTSGTLPLAYSSDWNPGVVVIGPTSGGATTPTRRRLQAADLPGGVGTVTSVAHTLTGSPLLVFTATGGPITTSGTLADTVNFANQPANAFLAGPTSGGTGAVTARAIAAADIFGLVPTVFSATPAFNAAAFAIPTFTMTLTGNVTSSSVTNPIGGQTIKFIITQDSTGGRSFAWPVNFKGASNIGSSANDVSVQTFTYDGTNWRAENPGEVVNT